MLIYEIGKPYPTNNFANGVERALIVPDKKFFEVVIYLNATSQDVKAFKNAKIRYGIFSREETVFFLLDFKGAFSFDASFNIKKFINNEDIENWLKTDANLLKIILVDARNNIIKKMKAIGLKEAAVKMLKEKLAAQYKSNLTAYEIDINIQAAEALFDTKKMFENCKKFNL